MSKCPTCGQLPKRSVKQNDQGHVWYEVLAKELPEDDALGWKCFCKLHFGVPILRVEDAKFKDVYDSTIKGMTYEQKLKAMALLPVTSRMNKGQKTKYFDAMREHFLGRGVQLLFINEEGIK